MIIHQRLILAVPEKNQPRLGPLWARVTVGGQGFSWKEPQHLSFVTQSFVTPRSAVAFEPETISCGIRKSLSFRLRLRIGHVITPSSESGR